MNKIREILNDDESVLVFDVDGVLAVMEWGEYTHFIASDEVWSNMYETQMEYYTEEYVSKTMQDFIKTKDLSRLYVITKAYSENEADDKKNFLNKYYGILKDHVYYVGSNLDKRGKLIEIKNIYPDLPDRKLVMIDDTVEVLSDIMDNTPYSTAHVSTFLDADLWVKK